MLTLILGGARSGKSALAEHLAEQVATPADNSSQLTYIATCPLDDADPNFHARVAAHQARRGESWHTVECFTSKDLCETLANTPGIVLVDSLGTWVSVSGTSAALADTPGDPIIPGDHIIYADLLATLSERSAPTYVVSEEVGLSIHPVTQAGRDFIDVLGRLNQQVAAIATTVLLVVAGQPIQIKPSQPATNA